MLRVAYLLSEHCHLLVDQHKPCLLCHPPPLPPYGRCLSAKLERSRGCMDVRVACFLKLQSTGCTCFQGCGFTLTPNGCDNFPHFLSSTRTFFLWAVPKINKQINKTLDGKRACRCWVPVCALECVAAPQKSHFSAFCFDKDFVITLQRFKENNSECGNWLCVANQQADRACVHPSTPQRYLKWENREKGQNSGLISSTYGRVSSHILDKIYRD